MIEWDAIPTELDGGYPILGYYIQANNAYDTDFVEPGVQIPVSSPLSHTFTGLTLGATYKFRVAAYNEVHTSNAFGSTLNFSPVTVLAAIDPAQVPSLTQNMNKLKKGTITMQWTAPLSNGSPILRYIIYKDNGLGIFYEVYRGLALEFTDIGLTPGGSYTYKVLAVNAAGAGLASTPLVGIAGERPSAPQNVRLVDGTKFKFEWDAPLDNGGLTIADWHCYLYLVRVLTML